jgi:hypothetical protein
LANNFDLPAYTIALYKQRFQLKLFSKWIKQNLRIKSFYSTSENAMNPDLDSSERLAIIKKRLKIEASLYII